MAADEANLHRCVGLLLCSDDRVLLAKRSSQKRWYPDRWDLVGGHIEAGETQRDAMIREASEELSITLEAQQLELLAEVKNDEVELTVFGATHWTGTPKNVATDEHDRIAWLTVAEIADLRLADPAITNLATKALELDQDQKPTD